MSFLACNIDRRGRMLRLATGGILLLAAVLFHLQEFHRAAWLLAAGGVFTLIEAARGWCVVRAFGFKTRY